MLVRGIRANMTDTKLLNYGIQAFDGKFEGIINTVKKVYIILLFLAVKGEGINVKCHDVLGVKSIHASCPV